MTCTVKIHHGQVISVTCKETGTHSARAVLSLSHGKRVVGWGQGTIGHTIALHHRAHLRGRYVLTVTVIGGPRTTLKVRF